SYGASSSSGEENVSSKHPPESGSFGFDSGNHTIKIQTKAWDEILQEGIENEVYLVKVDCEGCEKHLVAVDEDTITEFDAWAIETHSKKIRKNLERKFEKCGFDVEVSKKSTHRPSGKETSILHAEKVN
ncbi:MAG: FkbM family methyltransferase, partial [Candidatus Aenigmatarchaeota archaeon]